MTLQFLDLVNYDMGGRIFTYVLTLDALFRFTETGKEFGIDLLSKHTMHSDVSTYIAFSGEFFIQRLKRGGRSTQSEGGSDKTHPPHDVRGVPPHQEPPKDPALYILNIDNDSGTYRPSAELFPLLKEFLKRNLPGLKIATLDCLADAEKLQQMKKAQRERKKAEGDNLIYRQVSRSSSVSTSDEEALDALADQDEQETPEETGLFDTVRNEMKSSGKRNAEYLKDYKPGHRDKHKGFDSDGQRSKAN